MLEDKKLTCKDCKQEFIFTVREQEFFTEKGFSDPIRCLTCRRAKRQRRNFGGVNEN